MAIRTELSLRLPNSPGALEKVCQTLGDAKISIAALSLDSRGTLRLVVDNPLPAVGVLTQNRYDVEQREVLWAQLPNTPGALAKTALLVVSAGVNVEYAYGSAVDDRQNTAVVVGVDDALRASAATGI